jgi:hypothetical protein
VSLAGQPRTAVPQIDLGGPNEDTHFWQIRPEKRQLLGSAQVIMIGRSTQRRPRQPSHMPSPMPIAIAPASFLRLVMGTKRVG